MCASGLRRVLPAYPGYAWRFNPCVAFGVKDTMFGPPVSKLSRLVVDVWRYRTPTNHYSYSRLSSWPLFFDQCCTMTCCTEPSEAVFLAHGAPGAACGEGPCILTPGCIRLSAFTSSSVFGHVQNDRACKTDSFAQPVPMHGPQVPPSKCW